MISRVAPMRGPDGIAHDGSCGTFSTEVAPAVTCLRCLVDPRVTWALDGPCALRRVRILALELDEVFCWFPDGAMASLKVFPQGHKQDEMFGGRSVVLEGRLHLQALLRSTQLEVHWTVDGVSHVQRLTGAGAEKVMSYADEYP